MARPVKSMLTAYLLWFFLGWVGAHRMYLKRSLSGLFVATTNIFGVVMLGIGVTQETPEYVLVGGTTVLAVIVWILLEAFFIPGIVRQINEANEGRSYVSLGAVNLDPSHTATMAGVTTNQTGKSALPENYERPWHRDVDKTTIVRYRPEDSDPF